MSSCAICSDESAKYYGTWWDPDDGWRNSPLCKTCNKRFGKVKPKPDDYAYAKKDDVNADVDNIENESVDLHSLMHIDEVRLQIHKGLCREAQKDGPFNLAPGDEVEINTDPNDKDNKNSTKAKVVKQAGKPHYNKKDNSYLLQFDNGTHQYIPADPKKVKWGTMGEGRSIKRADAEDDPDALSDAMNVDGIEGIRKHTPKDKSNLELLKHSVEHHQAVNLQFKNGEDTIVDVFTASMLLKIYDALGDKNKPSFEEMLGESFARFMKLVNFGWSQIKGG